MFSVKTMMRSTVAVGGALALLASGASAASAATFTPTGTVVVKASTTDPITLKINGGFTPINRRTCLPGATAGTGSVANVGGYARITGLTLPLGSLTCTDGAGATYQTTINLSASSSQNNFNSNGWGMMSHLDINDPGPYGTGLVSQPSGFAFPATFINGTTGINGANPSKLTVVNGPVGHVRDTKYNPSTTVSIALSGSFNIGTATAPVNIS